MKRHISIFAFLLGAFAATESLAARQEVYAWGYWLPGQNSFVSDRDNAYVSPYSAVLYDWDDPASFSAKLEKGWKVDHWRYQVNSSFSDGDPDSVGSPIAGSANLSWPFKSGYGDNSAVYLAVRYGYVTYALNYDYAGGSRTGSDASKLYTDSFSLAPASVRTGCTFAGWKTGDQTFPAEATVEGESFKELDAVHDDSHTVTLTAVWATNTYTVTFDGNGSTGGSMGDETFLYGEEKKLTVNAFSKTGYVFAGWATNATEGAVVYADGQSVKNLTAVDGGTVSLYARWLQKFTVTFYEASQFWTGETEDTGIIVVREVEPEGDADPPPDPEHPGYVFNDWSGNYRNVTKDEKVRATYTANNYTVRFNANDGSGRQATQLFVYDEPKALSANPLPRIGYTLEGWAASEAPAVKKYNPGATVLNLATGGTVDLYALWKPISYTIAFDKNGGEGEMAGDTVEFGAEYIVPECGFERQGHEFRFWSAVIGGVATNFEAGAVVSNLASEAGVIVKFKAEWTGHYAVAFDANGGAGTMTNLTYEQGADYALPSNAFTKTGYRFCGWDDVLNKKRYADGETVCDLAPVGETNTLHAVWSANAYTVGFLPGGATGTMEDQPFVYDQPQALRNCTFDHGDPQLWSFVGWTNSAAGGPLYTNQETVVNLTAEPDGRVALTAVWKSELSDLALAMGCLNLNWENDKTAQWVRSTVSWPDGPDAAEISCVKSTGTEEAVLQSGHITANGVLHFWWKATGQREAVILNGETGGTVRSWRLDEGDDGEYDKWHEVFIDVDIGGNAFASFRISHRQGADENATCWIAKMTWTPEGGEPKYADEDTEVTDFSMADGKLSFSFDSDGSSTYHILGTNDVTAPWPWPFVREIGADETQPVQIDIKADEPKMFYRIRALIP